MAFGSSHSSGDGAPALPLSPEASAQPYTFETKDAVLSDADPNDSDPGAEVRDASDTNVSGTFTGTGFVALRKGVVTVDISTVPAGEYDLSVNYPSPFGAKYVDVDGVRYGDSEQCTQTFACENTAVWTPLALTDATPGMVTVDGSTGGLVITACFGFTYFDSVTHSLVLAAGTEAPAASGGIALGTPAPCPFGTSARIPFSLTARWPLAGTRPPSRARVCGAASTSWV